MHDLLLRHVFSPGIQIGCGALCGLERQFRLDESLNTAKLVTLANKEQRDLP
jgi:hypothetical protein